MHSGWACGDFIITSSLPTECIRIEKCAGLFFSYRGYRDNARMPVTRARIHPSFGREREREREIPLVSLTPVTLLLFFPPWISSCARRTVDVRRKGGRRIPLAEGQRQRERERGVVAGLYGGEREREREGEARGDAAGRGRWCAGDGTGSETRASANQSL